MTRLPLLDPHAQACSRITGRGYVIVPAFEPGEHIEIDRPEDQTPFPAVGETFFVGEAWSPWTVSHLDPAHAMYRPPRFRAAGQVKVGGRWQPARTLPEHMARTRFHVLSRSALRLGEVESQAYDAHEYGIERAYNAWIRYIDPQRNEVSGNLAFQRWWPLWTRQPYNPSSWVFLAHVERA